MACRHRSHDAGGNFDVAVDRLGVRADAVRRLGQLLRDLAVDARHTDGEARPQEEGIARAVQVDLGVDRRRSRQLDLPLAGSQLDRAEIAGRPGAGEEVLGRRGGCASLTSTKPSLLREAPSRPLVVRVRPVKRTFAVVVMAGFPSVEWMF